MIAKFFDLLLDYLKGQSYWPLVQPIFSLLSLYVISCVIAYQYIEWRYHFTPELVTFLHSYIIKQVTERGARYAHPTKKAEEEWVAEIKRLAVVAARFLTNCTPGYYNNEGHFGDGGDGLFSGVYAPGINAFNELMAKWREKNALEGLDLC